MEKKYSKRRRSQRILAVLFGAVILALSWVFLQLVGDIDQILLGASA